MRLALHNTLILQDPLVDVFIDFCHDVFVERRGQARFQRLTDHSESICKQLLFHAIVLAVRATKLVQLSRALDGEEDDLPQPKECGNEPHEGGMVVVPRGRRDDRIGVQIAVANVGRLHDQLFRGLVDDVVRGVPGPIHHCGQHFGDDGVLLRSHVKVDRLVGALDDGDGHVRFELADGKAGRLHQLQFGQWHGRALGVMHDVGNRLVRQLVQVVVDAAAELHHHIAQQQRRIEADGQIEFRNLDVQGHVDHRRRFGFLGVYGQRMQQIDGRRVPGWQQHLQMIKSVKVAQRYFSNLDQGAQAAPVDIAGGERRARLICCLLACSFFIRQVPMVDDDARQAIQVVVE
mmetsp:Transcript_17398/g.49061  ORF Transcript_17398/g.49061 Transcript_17398/m.49061 type:complete len:347 (-) Transcript_17398:2304-3344(-)